MFILYGVIVVAGLIAAWHWAAKQYRESRETQRQFGPTHADLHEMLIQVDAEILDLFDERADIIQAMRRTDGRA